MELSKITAATEQDAALLQSPEAQAILRAIEAELAKQSGFVALEARLDTLVPGWKTSEFWMTAIGHVGLVLTAAAGVLPPQYAAVLMALSQAAYTLSRGWAKNGVAGK